ncbi:type II toxin-antitoxin system RelE/ParE family toxin [Polynucleobacter sp. Latsch14-2]|jgi:proteic killer suppression protein|uniref:type II toxin-antitoxin system RelE/ParE family toxin n=1 Tax=Polynucleobacter sp. Latsch14-2 TaxID=2576920 RepID=UPI0021083228|nr:type II toxin-antitoxin system RelE/ParE family toxin [Polynucleobacter sp. Latsch14-2]
MNTITISPSNSLIQSFRHRGLELFYSKGSYRAIPAQYAARLERILDRLDAAISADDMDLPGYRFHRLSGKRKSYYAIAVSGNWRLTFRFDGDNAIDVDLEDYH